jgi:hypothetical protein
VNLRICLAILWLELPAAAYLPGTIAVDSGGDVRLVDLKDTALIAYFWESLHSDVPRLPGEYQVLLPPGWESNGNVLLLRNGTQVGRLERADWQSYAAFFRQEHVGRQGGDSPAPEDGVPLLWESLWADREKLLQWTAWPPGLQFRAASSMSAVPSVNPQFEQQYDLDWSQQLYRYFLLGAGFHRTEFGGGLSRRLELSSNADATFWTKPYWWWSLTAGIPVLRYELLLADRPLPQYFWLETSAASLTRTRTAGKVVKQWSDASQGHAGNLAHSLDLRFAHLRYHAHWDAEAYRVPIHGFFLYDLPAAFGRWGGGLVMASDILATRLWMDILDFDFSLNRPRAYPSDLRMAFLHLDMAYRHLKSFSLGASITLRLNNRILHLPGANP